MFLDRWIGLQSVNHRSPARRRFLQAVHENHRGTGRIELLKLDQPRLVRVLLRIQHTGKSNSFRPFARDQNRSRSAKINSQRKLAFVQCNALRLQWIDEFEVRRLAGKLDDGRGRRVKAAKFVFLAEPWIFRTSDRDQRRTDSRDYGASFKKLPADFQTVGRK